MTLFRVMAAALGRELRRGLGRLMGLPGGRPAAFLALAIGLIGAASLAVSAGLPTAALAMLTALLVNVLLAQSLNLLTGLAGQVSLGHAGFFGLGAYVSALAIRNAGFGLPGAVLAAMLAGGVAGLLISLPVGRLRLVPMAIITLAFGLIAEEVATKMTAAGNLTGLPSAALGNLAVLGTRLTGLTYFQVVLAVTILAVFLVDGLTRSSIGRALIAVRADETAAGTLGIPGAAMKRLAYTLSGALAGLAGALQVHLTGAVSPAMLDLPRSIDMLAMVLAGGLGSMSGQFVSAAVVTLLAEWVPASLPYRDAGELVLSGGLVALALLLAPRGIGAWFAPASFIDAGSQHLAGSRRTTAIPKVASRATNASLVAAGLSVEAGGSTVVDKIFLTLQPGRITALVGPDGAGKSALIDALTGLRIPSAGSARFFGRTITHRPGHVVAALGLRRSFQVPRLVPRFTVRENLLLGAHCRLWHDALFMPLGLTFAVRHEADILRQINALMDLAGLTELADRPCGTLPYGARKLTDIARLLIANPRMLLLDEPSAGLSEPEIAALVRLIEAARQAGVILMLAKARLDFTATLVDNVVVMDRGRVVFNGDIASLRADPVAFAACHGAATVAMPK